MPDVFRINRLDETGAADTQRLPHTVRILLEGLLRNAGGLHVREEDVVALAHWPDVPGAGKRVPFFPARVLLQDFTGVPAVVDLAAMRAAMARAGRDPARVDPLVPCDLVIDHSVQVDQAGSLQAYAHNIEREYERNGERYLLLRWAQGAFASFRVVPPGMGIVHQVNLEHLGRVVAIRDGVAVPDTLVGTDSHTTMINGLGVLGFGVGGIEAEAVMLGEPLELGTPSVVGVRLTGSLREGVTATDLVLTLTELLRRHGVVGRFVEFCGDGLSALSLADRATLANMSPEYGATAALFPVDDEVLRYLRATGRGDLVPLVDAHSKEQGLFRRDGDPTPVFSSLVELDLDGVAPSLAGPRRPQDRVPLADVPASFTAAYPPRESANGKAVSDGDVVIAAITSCTNTSNPSVMVAAGLLARNAVARGLKSAPHVKTSLAPGSRVVTDYLAAAGLQEPLDALGFQLVGYGCTTCIGNSGPLSDEISQAVRDDELAVCAVLSGNRNFEGRIHPLVRASYLASPPLVVAYALAGSISIDLEHEPLGTDGDGADVYLRDLWPSSSEVRAAIEASVTPELFEREYATIWDGDERWRALPAPEGALFDWAPDSTYVREPSFFQDLQPEPEPLTDIDGARCLVVLGDSVTTDHISPAGAIPRDMPAGRYLLEHDVEPRDFNSFGARRGNHEVMVRGTFGNIRLRNALADGREGSYTAHLPSGEQLTIFEVAERYRAENVPLVALVGKEYGSGSSRDWAAKGTLLLGIRAVIAESYERIHRSNLVGMGVLPLEYVDGQTAASLGLDGRERFAIHGIAGGVAPRARLTVEATADDGRQTRFEVLARVDSPADAEYLRHGGILPLVLRRMIAAA
ncbi:MAG: aconitate hydratase [Gaiellales bacterium]|nr:aconitate hydratase [Gaiellales bacterium]